MKLKQKKAKPNSKYWKKKADDAWAKEIRKVGRCEICGRVGSKLNAHHIISRTRLRFRHDLSNGICLCCYCHRFSPSFSPHVDTYSGEMFLNWLQINRPGIWAWYQEHKEDKRPPEKSYQQSYEELKKE